MTRVSMFIKVPVILPIQKAYKKASIFRQKKQNHVVLPGKLWELMGIDPYSGLLDLWISLYS